MAFTISATEATVYFNGQLVKQSTFTGIDWTGSDILSIMSGAPRFTGWDHKSDNSFMDDLRLFNKALTQDEIQNIIGVTNPYEPADGETFYMPFNDDYVNAIGGGSAVAVGTPGFSGESKKGSNAYAGATDSYLTFPTTGLLSEEFSTTFWYKVNASPDRAGIIVISPENEASPDLNNLNSGFHMFREGGADEQRIKASVGNGTAQFWNDGGVINVTAGEWVHVALTISNSESKIYLNGDLTTTSSVTGGVDWTGTDLVSIMSGAPRFIEWNHKSDLSYMDELRFFNKALTQSEIQDIMAE
jgi:hypothetical protein